MATDEKSATEKQNDAFNDGYGGFFGGVYSTDYEYMSYHHGQQARKRQEEARKAKGPMSPSQAIGGVIGLVGLFIYLGYDAVEMMAEQRRDKALVAHPSSPTHYTVNPNAKYFYVSGSAMDKPAVSSLVEAPLGKCFDLSKSSPMRPGTTEVYLEDYNGKVWHVYTSSATFARLPEGAECKYGYYSN